MNSVDLDPTNTLVVTGTMDGKCPAVQLVIIAVTFMSFCVQSVSIFNGALNSSLLTFSILLTQSLYAAFFWLSLCNVASHTDALYGLVTQSSWDGDCVTRIKSVTSFCQALSALVSLVVGRETLVAASHLTTQNLDGKKICWAGRGGRVLIVAVANSVGFKTSSSR